MKTIIALDTNPFMFRSFSETDPETPYGKACSIIKKVLEEPMNRKKKRQIHLYRGQHLVSKKLKTEDIESIKEDTSTSSLFHFGDFFDKIESNYSSDSMMIIFTDASSFTGSITRFPHCRTRFVITTKDAKEVDPKQLWDLEEASKRSINHKISEDDTAYYSPHLYYKVLEKDLVVKLYEDMYPEIYYTLWNGYQSQKFRLKPTLSGERIGNVHVIGYVTAVNMVNSPVTAHLRMLVKPERKVRTEIRQQINRARRRKQRRERSDVKTEKFEEETNNDDETSPKKIESTIKKERSPRKSRDEKKNEKSKEEELEPSELKIETRSKKNKKSEESPQKIVKGKRLSDSRSSKSKGKIPKKSPLKRRYQSNKDKKRAPRNALFKLMYHGLKKEDMVAICRFPSGVYAAIQPLETKDGISRMFVNMLPVGRDRPSFQPCFDKGLKSGQVKTEAAAPLHIAEKATQLASYDSNVANWMFNTSFNNDIQKLIRLMKRLPDRKHLFYTEVNRIRNHAVLIGMYEVLPVVANVLRDECKSMDTTAQMHGKYVATWFDREVIADDMTEVATL